VVTHLTLGPDLQLVHNPGYNRDRAPARFVGLRMHVDL
jgi:carbohydrate-selective porin OprB